MVFMCDICVKPPFLARDDNIRQQPPSQFQKQTNCLFCIRVLSENQKEAFRAPYLEKTEATGVMRTTVHVSDVRNMKEVALTSPTGAKREPYKYVESFDKAAIRQFYTVRKESPTPNTLNSTLVRYLSFPGSVETQRKRLGQLVYCWK